MRLIQKATRVSRHDEGPKPVLQDVLHWYVPQSPHCGAQESGLSRMCHPGAECGWLRRQDAETKRMIEEMVRKSPDMKNAKFTNMEDLMRQANRAGTGKKPADSPAGKNGDKHDEL